MNKKAKYVLIREKLEVSLLHEVCNYMIHRLYFVSEQIYVSYLTYYFKKTMGCERHEISRGRASFDHIYGKGLDKISLTISEIE